MEVQKDDEVEGGTNEVGGGGGVEEVGSVVLLPTSCFHPIPPRYFLFLFLALLHPRV